jgi:hypothetical protein
MSYWLLFFLPVVGLMLRCMCCGSCKFADDMFGRSDGTDISTGSSCGWTEDLGSWSLASGELTTTSSDAIAKCNAEHPLPSSAMSIACLVRGTTSGDKARIIAGYTDANNYICMELTFVTGAVKIISRSSGSETILASGTTTLSVSINYDVIFCVSESGSSFIAKIGSFFLYASGTSTGTYAALGAKSASGNAVYFDNFTATDTGDDCPSCVGGCTPCTPEIRLDRTTNTGGCCADLAGSYYVTFINSSRTEFGCTGCEYYRDKLVCSRMIQVHVFIDSNMLCIVFDMDNPSFFNQHFKDSTFVKATDCQNMVNRNIPLFSTGGGGGSPGSSCSGSYNSDTVHATSI